MLVNIKTGQRSTLKDHHVQQCDPVVYHVSNCAILAGGIYVYTNDTSRSVEMCDPTSNVWSFLLDMPQATSGATVGVIDKKVYVADGKGDGSWSLVNLQVYDTVLETWKLGPEMPGYLSMTSGAVVENTFVFILSWDQRNGSTLTPLNRQVNTVCLDYVVMHSMTTNIFGSYPQRGTAGVMSPFGTILEIQVSGPAYSRWLRLKSLTTIGDTLTMLFLAVFKLWLAGARVEREHRNSSFLLILVKFPHSTRLSNLHVLFTLVMY